MAKGQLHLSPNGPAPCGAEAGECPYEASGHFDSLSAAESAFAEEMGGALPQPNRKAAGIIRLSSNLGDFEVLDGDLSDARTRAALSSGLCGDLALAIHRQTGGRPYFLSYSYGSEEALAAAFAEHPNAVIAGATHVVIESPTRPGHFVDSYGQQDQESLEDLYEDAVPIPGTVEMLEHFADQANSERLNRFASSALELDAQSIRYESDLDELGWDDEDEEDDEEEVSLELDFGSVSVRAGDLSDPQTRHYLSNGLCGDLAMEIREQQGGGSVHFVVDSTASQSDLSRAAESRTLGDHVAHAVVESRSNPGYFIDAYGLKSREEVERFYGMELREVPVYYLQRYGSRAGC